MFHNSNSDAAASGSVVPENQPAEQRVRPVVVRHVVFGPEVGLEETIKSLHKRGYAEPNDWSKPQPTSVAEEFVTVLIRRMRVERGESRERLD